MSHPDKEEENTLQRKRSTKRENKKNEEMKDKERKSQSLKIIITVLNKHT